MVLHFQCEVCTYVGHNGTDKELKTLVDIVRWHPQGFFLHFYISAKPPEFFHDFWNTDFLPSSGLVG